ncbi:hypothetical protein [Nonomuraea sp. LPB2021202275-12-8]|uniref:hypothetical protein n=1 Tax=Nonomuraea sp. LPB2021202275-12-8 TaxID=3120159 RepID=UPI00300D403B
MTHSLTDQRSRPELVAELYDRHAAGLYAYCADQLGDPGSAADVLVAVLTSVPVADGQPGPPRAALYAFARREIHRRDVVYSPPVVDPLIDPASALVERALRELRLQQREVLVLTQICGLNRAELAWVLDVAPDTAEELAINAAHRLTQALGLALATTERRVPKPVADVYGALTVAPLRDVLGRLPWPSPPGSLRVHFAGSLTAGAAPLFVKPRWPVPPTWPLPLGEADPATTTGLFPTELLTPPPSRVAAHEATTAPMPKLSDPLAASPESAGPFPSKARRVFDAPPTPFAAFEPRRRTPAGTPPRKAPVERPFIMPSPVPADVLDDLPRVQEPPATGDVIVPGDAGRLFTPRSAAAEPVYRMPLPEPAAHPRTEAVRPQAEEPEARVEEPRAAARPRIAPEGAQSETRQSEPRMADTRKPPAQRSGAQRPGAGRPAGKKPGAQGTAVRKPARPRQGPPARRPGKKKRRQRHHDWAWELIGFGICVVIAMIVFFSVPMIISP